MSRMEKPVPRREGTMAMLGKPARMRMIGVKKRLFRGMARLRRLRGSVMG